MSDKDGQRLGALTMRELAKALELNIATVSRALDPTKAHLVAESTRQRVLDAVDATGYTPHPTAAGLRRHQSFAVGLLVPDLGNETIVEVSRSIMAALDTADRFVLIAESMDDPGRTADLLHRFRGRRVEALIVLAATEADRADLERFSRTTPVILAVRKLNRTTLPTVTCNDRLGGSMVATHLSDLGHVCVAQVSGPQISQTFVDRRVGFEATCHDRDVEVVSAPEARHATLAEGQRSVTALLQSAASRPTAIFAHNDAMAVGAMVAIREAGLACPGDISIVGYNDTPIAQELATPLTSIRYPTEQVGSLAAAMTIDLIDHRPLTRRTVVLRPSLVKRASSQAPPRGNGRS